MEEENDPIAFGDEEIDFCALAEFEETQEFRDALEFNKEIETLRSLRTLSWADETGMDLFQVIEYESEKYWNA